MTESVEELDALLKKLGRSKGVPSTFNLTVKKVSKVKSVKPALPKLVSDYTLKLCKSVFLLLSVKDQINWRFMVFGKDITPETYQKLAADIIGDKVKSPPIKVASTAADIKKLKLNIGAFDENSQTLLIDANLAKKAQTSDVLNHVLFLVLAEITGHYLEYLLRNSYSSIGGESAKDEGSPFAFQLYRDSKDDLLKSKIYAKDTNAGFEYKLDSIKKLAKVALKLLSSKLIPQSQKSNGIIYYGGITSNKRWEWATGKPYAKNPEPYLRYSHLFTAIEQRADFYLWFYEKIRDMGHEITWPLAAHMVSVGAMQVASYDSVVGSNTLSEMALRGNQAIFDDVLPKLEKLYKMKKPLKGKDALAWDMVALAEEQNFIQAMYDYYDAIDKKHVDEFEEIAKGSISAPAARIGANLGNLSGCYLAAEGVCKSKGKYNKDGFVPVFPSSSDIRKVFDRWWYGMNLAFLFVEDGKPYDIDAAGKKAQALLTTQFEFEGKKFIGMPNRNIIPAKYYNGSEFKNIDIKLTAHKFKAELDDNLVDEKKSANLFKNMNAIEYYTVREDPWYTNSIKAAHDKDDITSTFYSERVDMKAYFKYLRAVS